MLLTSPVAEHRNYLVQVAMKYGLSYQDAEDAVHDMHLRLQRQRPVCDAEGCSRAWLAARLRWQIANARRNAQRVKRGAGSAHVPIEEAIGVMAEGDPCTALELRQLRERLTECGATEDRLFPVGTQSPKQRTALCRLRQSFRALLTPFYS